MSHVRNSGKQERDYFFDNAKFILITLVVISHAITPFIGTSGWNRTLYLLLFTFHMPLFLFISGFFAKKTVQNRELVKPIQKLLVPYIVIQTIYSFFYYDVLGWELEFSYFYPHWSLWFLVTLFTFYYLVHLFKFSPYFIIVAVLISIISGYVEIGSWFSLSRTLVFFPFFLAGYYVKREHLQFLYERWLKTVALIFIAVTTVVTYMYAFDIPYELLYGSMSYHKVGLTGWSAGLWRLGAYVISVAMSISFLALIPKEKTSFSHLAQNTLYVYLLHGFIFRYLRETNFYDEINTVFETILLLISSVIFTFILSSPIVKKVAAPILQPFSFLKKK